MANESNGAAETINSLNAVQKNGLFFDYPSNVFVTHPSFYHVLCTAIRRGIRGWRNTSPNRVEEDLLAPPG